VIPQQTYPFGRFDVSPYVADQSVEYVSKAREFSLGDASTEPLVERHRSRAQTEEYLFTSIGQLHDMNSSVASAAASGDESFGVHRVEVMSERRLPYPDGLGQLTLVAGAPNLQIQQYQPFRQGPSHLVKRLIESPPHDSGGASETKTDRWLERGHPDRIAQPIDF
jgi:hypothetical protein